MATLRATRHVIPLSQVSEDPAIRDYAGAYGTTIRSGRSEGTRHQDPLAPGKRQRHHPFPQYLGGRYRQQLVNLPNDLHYLYHGILDRVAGMPRNLRARHYRNLNGAQMLGLLKRLVRETRQFDAQHNTQLTPALRQSIREAQPLRNRRWSSAATPATQRSRRRARQVQPLARNAPRREFEAELTVAATEAELTQAAEAMARPLFPASPRKFSLSPRRRRNMIDVVRKLDRDPNPARPLSPTERNALMANLLQVMNNNIPMVINGSASFRTLQNIVLKRRWRFLRHSPTVRNRFLNALQAVEQRVGQRFHIPWI